MMLDDRGRAAALPGKVLRAAEAHGARTWREPALRRAIHWHGESFGHDPDRGVRRRRDARSLRLGHSRLSRRRCAERGLDGQLRARGRRARAPPRRCACIALDVPRRERMARRRPASVAERFAWPARGSGKCSTATRQAIRASPSRLLAIARGAASRARASLRLRARPICCRAFPPQRLSGPLLPPRRRSARSVGHVRIRTLAAALGLAASSLAGGRSSRGSSRWRQVGVHGRVAASLPRVQARPDPRPALAPDVRRDGSSARSPGHAILSAAPHLAPRKTT